MRLPNRLPQAYLNQLEWREIGPWRGGRSCAVSGVPGEPDHFYMGATGGGVWKTTDAGQTWSNVSDGFLKTGTVGSIAVSESNPKVVYVGMGESEIRGNITHGDGVYRSNDAGKTWRHLGLEKTEVIGKVRIHPTNPDIAWVAALGKVWGQVKIAEFIKPSMAARLGRRLFLLVTKLARLI
ncbi:MAG: hypothetical protein R2688_03140 [Fimbriimonadaceae bacterium]